MRLATVSAAMCLAAAGATGCNQIFGIDNTTQLPDEEAGIVKKLPLALRITQQRATTQGDGLPVTQTEPLTAADVDVKIGPLTGDLQATEFVDGAFVYQRRAPDGVPMPMPVLERLRAVVTVAGQPPLELQWNDIGQDAALAYTRIGRENAPGGDDDFIANSGWLLEEMPSIPIGTVLFTTGSWWETTTAGTNALGQLPIRWDASGTRTLGDTRVRPSAAAGDVAILAERIADPDCSRVTNRSTTFASQPQEDPYSDPVAPVPLLSSASQKANVNWAVPATSNFAQVALGALIDEPLGRTGTVAFGFLPNADVATVLPIGARAKPGFQDPPLMTLLECPPDRALMNGGGPGYAVVNVLEDHYQAAVVAQMKWRRGTGNAVFESGFEIVALAAGTAGQAKDAAPDRTAAFAQSMSVTRGAAALDLTDGTMDGTTLAGDGPLVLSFVAESGKAVHLWSVSLVRIEGATRTIERVVLTSELQVTFQPPRPGTYVFAIRGHMGHPGAPSGDFAMMQFPQVATLATTRAFVVP